MTLEEYINLQAQWQLDTSKFAPDFQKFRGSEFAQTLEVLEFKIHNTHSQFDGLRTFLEAYQQQMSKIASSSKFSELQGLKAMADAIRVNSDFYRFSQYKESFTVFAEMMTTLTAKLPLDDLDIRDSIEKSVAEAESFMSPPQQAACKDVISTKLHRPLSLSDALTIFSILVTIWTTLMSQLPNEQLDRLIEQQQQQTEYLEEIIELKHQENDALMSAIGLMTQTIEQLSDEIEVLKEQYSEDDADSLPLSPSDDTAPIDHE